MSPADDAVWALVALHEIGLVVTHADGLVLTADMVVQTFALEADARKWCTGTVRAPSGSGGVRYLARVYRAPRHVEGSTRMGWAVLLLEVLR